MMRHKYKTITIIIALSILFLTTARQIVHSQKYIDSDFFSFWLAGRMMLTGENPYHAEAWIEGHHKFGAEWISDNTFLYPLPAAIGFIPLGFLRIDHAYVAWVFLSQWLISAALYLLFRIWRSPTSMQFLLPIVLGVILFRPALVTLRNGQLGGMFLFLLVLVIYLWENDKWVQGSIALSLVALKPQYGIPILLLLAIWLVRHKKIPALLALSVSGVLLFVLGWLIDSSWVSTFLEIASRKSQHTFGFNPTMWGVSAYVCENRSVCTFLVGGSFSLLLTLPVLIFTFRIKETLSAFHVGIVTTTTLIVTPYIWAYDQILLLIPMFLIVAYLANNGYTYLKTSLVFLAFSIMSLGLLFLASLLRTDVWSALLPILVLLALIWLYAKKINLDLSNSQPLPDV